MAGHPDASGSLYLSRMRVPVETRLDAGAVGQPEGALWHAAVPVSSTEDPGQWGAHLDALVEEGALHPEEREEAGALPAGRQPTFVAGRVALRSAWRAAHEARHGTGRFPSAAIRRSARGAPLLPHGAIGSISHKQTRACAVAAWPAAGLLHVGIDLERRPNAHDLARPSIARRILTAHEHDWVGRVTGSETEARELVHVHFALKEAVYKAIDPLVNRYVGFTEVELDLRPIASPDPRSAGTATVRAPIQGVDAAALHIAAEWRVEAEWIVAVARTMRRATEPAT